MAAYFASIELRDDGFLEVLLNNEEEFDDYIYQQMLRDGSTLACVRDPKRKNCLYYDTKGYISLHSYMKSYTFEENESCQFLIYILEQIIQVNANKPVYMDIDYIFIDYEGGSLHFLVLPISVDKWVFQKEECQHFITSLIKHIHISNGYEAIGYLAYVQRYEDMKLPVILQGLHDLEEKNRKKPTVLEKIFHLHEEENYFIKDIPQAKVYPRYEKNAQINETSASYQEVLKQKDIRHETVVLFNQNQYALMDKNQILHPIDKKSFQIGRSKDNDLVLSQPYVSAYHASISDDIITDLSSSNGTFVNGERIETCKLNVGDTICFAKEKYSFVMHT